MSTTIMHNIDNNTSSITLTLDNNQIDRIIEALLFSASINIGAEWQEDDLTAMFDLAKKFKKLRKNDINLEKICFYKEENYEDNWTEDLFKTFKKNIKTIKLENA
jgi:hypothetical protein